MIFIRKKIIISVLGLTIAGATLLDTPHVFAQSNGGQLPSLVQMIATKFGLNPTDVQTVFDDYKTQRQSQMETSYEAMLSQAVKDGKISQAQMQLILAKHKELQADRSANISNWKNETPDQRKASMQTQKQALQTWATQNGIDIKYLFGGFGMRGHVWFNK